MGNRGALMLAVIIVFSVFGQFSSEQGTGTIFVSHGKDVEVLGDWNITGSESYENQTIYLDGNLTVLAGGSLSFKNSTLMLNLSESGEHWLKVYGSLSLSDLDNDSGTGQDSSLLCSNSSEFYQLDAYDGSVLEMRNSRVTSCGFDGTYRGLTVATPSALFEGMNFTGNYYGLYIKKTGAVIRNSVFYGNTVGLGSYQAGFEFTNNTIAGSSSDGLSVYYSSPLISRSRFISNWNGLNLRYFDGTVESCTATDNLGSGIYVNSCSPLVVNSTLANSKDLTVVADSFPRLLNTSFAPANTSVGFGLYASVGQFCEVQVVNGTGQPMGNVSVSVLDSDGNPASSGLTNSTGSAGQLCFREAFLTESGLTGFGTHRVIAFSSESGTVFYGENLTALAPNGFCEVQVQQDPPGVEIWLDPYITTAQWCNASKVIALSNVQVDWGGSLFVNDSEVMLFSCQASPILFICENGEMGVFNTSIYSIGTQASLAPGRTRVGVSPDCPAAFEKVRTRWTEYVFIYSSLVTVKDLDVRFAQTCGLEVTTDITPKIENVYVEWASSGLYMLSDMSQISNVSLAGVRNYGVYASGSRGALANMSVARASKGVYSPSSVITFSDLDIQDCSYGIHAMYGHVKVLNSTILASTAYGVYSIGGSLRMTGCQISSSPTGLRLQDTSFEQWLESCDISGNNYGISAKRCRPVILNSTLCNAIDVSVERATFASLVNCSVNLSKVWVAQSGYVDIGHWAYATVLDQTLLPVEGCTVSLADASGQVSASDLTDANGRTGALAFRERRLFANRTELYPEHELLAFKTDNQSWFGTNVTPLSPDAEAEIILYAAGEDWLEWTGDREFSVKESFQAKTIVARGDILVQSTGGLNLINSTLWMFVTEQTDTGISAYGSLHMSNVTLAPISAGAPLQPAAFSLTYEEGGSGEISTSRLSDLGEVALSSAYPVELRDTEIERAAMSGVRIEGNYPVLDNLTVSLCYDGITSNSADPEIRNCTLAENGRYGLTASAGAPAVSGTLAQCNEIGFILSNGAAGLIENCTSASNTHGVYLSTASPWISASNISQNSNSGIYLYRSYSVIFGCQVTQNAYGAYCLYSSPSFGDSSISSNSFAFYLYYSGPHISGCRLDANSYGLYQIGEASNQEAKVFSSGREREVATLLNNGTHDGYGITLPRRARLKQASMSVEGILLKNEAVLEDTYWQMGHAIYENWLVWHDNRDGNWEIYAYDLAMDSDGNGVPNYIDTPVLENDPALVRITDNPASQFNADIYEDTIVWMDLRNGNSDIYAYTFSNRTEWPVATEFGDQINPSIYGDHIVWSDEKCGCEPYKIYMLTISNGTVSKISDSPWDDYAPDIFKDRVVWNSYTGSPGGSEYSDVFMFDIEKWGCSQLTKDGALQYIPTLFDNYVVWHDNRNVNWEIYLYNLSTHFEERITYETEQSFCPSMWENRIVYYFHDRNTDEWAVRMYDLQDRVQKDIAWLYGDAHPVIYGDRIAWLDKTDIMFDIYVLDFNLVGWPRNVSVDLGMDGDAEFARAGEFQTTEPVPPDVLFEELREYVPGVGPGTVDIPINISFEGPGRVGLSSLWIIYDLPTLVEATTISNSSCGVYCYDARPQITNVTFADDSTDIRAERNSDPVLLNSTFSAAKLQFVDVLANVTVKNYLHVRAENESASPLNASMQITDNGQEIFNETLGGDGTVEWLAVTDARYNSTGRHDNETIAAASYGPSLFVNNPRSVDMGTSHWELFVTETTPPVVSQEFPMADWMCNSLYPTISVWVTDNVQVNISSVRLYVQGFSVMYNSEPVPGGFNISYYHELGFTNGGLVRCRIFAKDTSNNVVDYSWSFRINLAASYLDIPLESGWNLVSIPFETMNSTLESVLHSIEGQYDIIRAYNSADSDHWKAYSAYWPAALNDLNTIDRSMGIWIHATSDCTLMVSGILHDSTSIPLRAGWNLVGYPSMSQETVANALWGTGADRVEVFDPAEPYMTREIGPTYLMRPGEGYWVHVPVDTIWIVNW